MEAQKTSKLYALNLKFETFAAYLGGLAFLSGVYGVIIMYLPDVLKVLN